MHPGKVFEYERRVAVADTDMVGIAHFTAYLRWVEEAENAFYRAAGVPFLGCEPDGAILGWPRVSLNVEYLGPVHFDDLVIIRLSIARDGRSSREWSFEIHRPADDKAIARGTMKTVHAAISREGKISSRPIAR